MIQKDNYGYSPLSNNNSAFALTRAKLNYCRIVLITSLFWVLVDAFIILYFTDCGSNRLLIQQSQLPPCDPSKPFYGGAGHLPDNLVKSEDVFGKKDLDYDDNLKAKNERLHNVHKQKQQKSRHHETTTEANGIMNRIKQWFREDGDQPTNPSHWPGEGGRAVVVPDELKEEVRHRFPENQFNIVASDLMALNRSVPDQRSSSCKSREYPFELPTTSIIIVYHNEGNSTLLRGLVSIVRKSPVRYLKEIILVDDASVDRDYLHDPLDEFVKSLPVPVKIFRNKERMGLMRSRLRGADAATGDTMTFLDAHIEATDGWLTPLLSEIKKNRKAIACPIIDVISDENFAYLTGSETTYGGFNEKLNFRWYPAPERENRRRGGDKSLPMRTPTMAGGLFTIDREYFYELGAYDEGMDVWGAENLEMSFRIWMCGGVLLICPCSHVGHVFRKQTPYQFPGGTNQVIFRNNRRLIDVWTDEYSTYFHKIIPELNNIDSGDLTKRIELRKNLNCKSFKWYLDNIYPEAPLPIDFYHVGAVVNTGINFCLDNMGRKSGEDAGATFCHSQGGNQIFEYSKSNQLVSAALCLDTQGSNGVVKLNACNKNSKSQKWDYDNMNETFKNRQSATCLAISETNNVILITMNCDASNKMQKWSFRDSLFSPAKPNA